MICQKFFCQLLLQLHQRVWFIIWHYNFQNFQLFYLNVGISSWKTIDMALNAIKNCTSTMFKLHFLTFLYQNIKDRNFYFDTILYQCKRFSFKCCMGYKMFCKILIYCRVTSTYWLLINISLICQKIFCHLLLQLHQQVWFINWHYNFQNFQLVYLNVGISSWKTIDMVLNAIKNCTSTMFKLKFLNFSHQNIKDRNFDFDTIPYQCKKFSFKCYMSYKMFRKILIYCRVTSTY